MPGRKSTFAPAGQAQQSAPSQRERRPLHPYPVLLVAVILPGAGQVLNRMPTRALIMVFFMLSLALVSVELAPPGRSFVGRHAGGIFIYAIAVMDAYANARFAWERHKHRRAHAQAHGNDGERAPQK